MSEQKKAPKVGQTIFRLVGVALVPVKVARVGRKYFVLEGEVGRARRYEYHNDSWMLHSDYSGSRSLWESQQEYQDEIDRVACLDLIRETYCRILPITALRQIADIILKHPKP